MTEVERIEDQLRRAIEGAAWHGPSVQHLLADVTVDQAIAKPVGGAHSIFELLFHMGGWEGVALKRLRGSADALPDDQNWPSENPSDEAAWNDCKARFEHQNEQLRRAILELSDDQLASEAPGADYSFYYLLHGVIQHDLYHGGQIALLKRAVRT